MSSFMNDIQRQRYSEHINMIRHIHDQRGMLHDALPDTRPDTLRYQCNKTCIRV